MRLICAFQLGWAGMAPSQQAPPTIDVVFEIAAEPFKSSLSPKEREEVELAIAEKLARLCSDPVAYLNWKGSRAPSPTLALKVELRSESAGYNDEIFLQYTFIRDSARIPWPPHLKKTVYEAFALSLPSHKPKQLAADVLDNIEKSFANEDFRKVLHERLATTVPITETITFDQATQRCVLPLKWESLSAKDTSILLATFKAQSPNEPQPRQVEIRMAPERSENELKCRVFEFRHPPDPSMVVEQTKELSNPKISECLRDKIGPAAVYMEKYERDFRANTSGALLLTPPTR